MGFLSNLVSEFTEGQQNANIQQTGSYGGYSSNNAPPQVSYPWEARWDNNRNTWIFVNRETGQSTYEYPGQAYGGGGLGAYEQAGATGLAGYEDQRIRNDYDQDKYRVENDVYNAPENAARWTGEKVQEVEDIPQDVDRWGRRKVDEVEDLPEDAANWAGRKVQEVEDIPQDIEEGVDDVVDAPKRWFDRKEDEVEQFGDRVDNSFDQGEDEQQERDDNRYDDYN